MTSAGTFCTTPTNNVFEMNTSVNINYIVHSIYYNRHSKFYILVLLFYVLGVVTLKKLFIKIHKVNSHDIDINWPYFLQQGTYMLTKLLLGSLLCSTDGVVVVNNIYQSY